MNRRHLLAAAIASVMALGAQAQTYPDKPVKIILPFPTGTGPDTIMRLVGERLSRMWGQQVVIDNKAGGNGWIAMDAVKRATPDGYTLMQSDAPPFVVHPYLFKKLPHDVAKDFEPVAGLYRTYYYVTVAADSPYKTLADLIAAAKAKPGQINYGSSGLGGNLHLGGAMMEKMANVKMTHVPYKETTQIYMDISKGDIGWAVGTASTTMPMLKGGKVKYLAITAPKRSPLFPDVPTVAEAKGPANYELQTWVGLFAPRGVPKAIVNKINADVAKVLQDPEIRERLQTVGFEALVQSADDMGKLIAADAGVYRPLIRDLNISLD